MTYILLVAVLAAQIWTLLLILRVEHWRRYSTDRTPRVPTRDKMTEALHMALDEEAKKGA
jgi:hypothetical protein